jgi:hypothetical protein
MARARWVVVLALVCVAVLLVAHTLIIYRPALSDLTPAELSKLRFHKWRRERDVTREESPES